MAKKKTKKEKPRKLDFEVNHGAIRDAYLEILKEQKGKRPTLAQISERTHLSITTVKKHIDELDLTDLKIKNASLKVLTDDVSLAVYRAAMKGSSASQKLWYQIVEGWNEKQITEHEGKIETTAPAPPVILKIGKD